MKPLVLTIMLPLMLSGYLFAAEPKLTEEQLSAAIESRLMGQLNNAETAADMTRFLMQQVLTWKAETIDIKQADTIIAYAFGNRIDKNGNKLPGPMNQQLADLVVDVYNEKRMPVYAQWEIAEAIGGRIDADDLIPVYPKVDDSGQVIYLSTLGVAEETVRLAKGVDNIGTALIIAFYEHHLRAVSLSRAAGIRAYAPDGFALPNHYDEKSGQPWTRDNAIFTLYEVGTRAFYARERLMAEQKK